MASILYKGKTGGGLNSEIIPNQGSTKDGLIDKVFLFFHGNQQGSNIGSGYSVAATIGDPGSGNIGLSAFVFNGTPQDITPNINSTLAGLSKFTIGCWVKFNSFNFAGAWGAWAGTGSTGQIAIYNIGGGSTTSPQLIVTQNNGSFYQINGDTNTWQTNRWHYCLADVDIPNLIIRFWIDNQLQGTASLPSGFVLNTSSFQFKVGGYNGFGLNGNIQEFVIFEDTLTPTERDWLWNNSYGNTLLELPPPDPSSDPYADDVVLLTYANKPGTSFTDVTGKTITLTGVTNGFNPSNVGSIPFPNNAASHGSLAANQSDFWFGSGDWTMEFYVSSSNWYNGAAFFGAIFFVQRNLSDQYGIAFNYYNGNLRLTANADGTNIKLFSWTPSNNIGYLIAIHRDGDDIRCAVNGAQVGTTQSWAGVTLNNVTSPNRFGGDSFNTHGTVNFHGIRITKGIARDIFNPDPLPWAY